MSLLLKEHYSLKPNTNMLNEMREADREGRPVVVVGIIQRADSKNQNGRIYPKSILEKEIDRYKREVIGNKNGMGELDHCLLGENEVMTSNGWKRLDEMTGDEIVQTYNVETGEIEESPVLKVHKFHHKGKMIHLTNKKKMDIMMTPNHRMLLWDRNDKPYYIEARHAFERWKENDSTLNHSKILSSGNWKGKTPSYFNIPNTKINIPIKAWVSMFGLWLAEGHVSGSRGGSTKGNYIVIHQKKKENIQKIRELLQSTELDWKEKENKDGKYEWSIGNKEIHSYFSQFGNSETKYIPKEILDLDKNLLSLMFDWMLLGDGRNRKSPSGELIKEYSTISKNLSLGVEELIFKLGYRSFTKSHVPEKDLIIEGRVIKKENCKELFTVAVNKSATSMDSRFINFREVDFDDNVYCITTKNSNFLTKCPNGYICWTGNTDQPLIQLQNVSHILEDVWWDGEGKNEVWGKIKLLPTPRGDIAKNIILQGIPLGISSRAVGTVDSRHDGDYVNEDLNLICWDLVGTPSTDNAYLKLHEAKEIKNFNPKNVYPAQYRIKDTLRRILGK